jgi:hypothetical protein
VLLTAPALEATYRKTCVNANKSEREAKPFGKKLDLITSKQCKQRQSYNRVVDKIVSPTKRTIIKSLRLFSGAWTRIEGVMCHD